ncbi:MAG: hypothetical protein QOJ29_622, partial [Thermoleophilaceae bacterium]|nr:hypothetical protein [Thermoleophilaceae bacterium]
MNLERLRWGEWIAGIAALDLLLVTFRAWYKLSGGDARVTAWDALDNGRFLLIATAVVGIFLLLIVATEQTAEMSLPPGWIAAAVGLASTVYVAYRLSTPPSDALDPDIGLFLGLVSSLGVAIGGLLSARDATAAPAAPERTASDVAQDTFSGPTGPQSEPLGALVPDSGGTFSAAPSSTGWSPAAPAAPVPPATVAGAGSADRALQAGDQVVLTAGGARFPAGTLAEVIEVFGGGALVEVKAPDGVGERFEVPDSAYQPVPAGGAAVAEPAGGESWSPAMPAAAGAAAASQDWGFDDAAVADEAPAKEKKVPFWKRKLGGGGKADAADETVESDAMASEAEVGLDEPEPSAAPPEPEPAAVHPEPSAVEPEPVAVEPEPEPEPPAVEPEPEPTAPEPEPPAPEPEPAADAVP